MSKAKRRLAGLGSTAKLITGSHLPGATAGNDTLRDLREQLQKEQVQREALIAEQVRARTANLKTELGAAMQERDTRIAALREELEAAEAKAWELGQQLENQIGQAREGGAQLPGAHELRLLQPDDFAPRPMDSDEISERDIAIMADMIAEQGLLQWPVVDVGNRPLAGRRRSLALARLAQEAPERFAELFPQGVPVIAMLEIDWDRDPLLADQEMLLMQHTQRRRDRPAIRDAKIRDLARRMRQDPRAKWKGGRLAEGEYHALKRLTQLFGVSDKMVQRALAGDSSADEGGWGKAKQAFARQLASTKRLFEDLPEQAPGWAAWVAEGERLLAWLDDRAH